MGGLGGVGAEESTTVALSRDKEGGKRTSRDERERKRTSREERERKSVETGD